jgi:hypothetical protein
MASERDMPEWQRVTDELPDENKKSILSRDVPFVMTGTCLLGRIAE